MSFTFGAQPEQASSFVKLDGLPYLQKSGLYHLRISRATYRQGQTKDNRRWEQMHLSCAVIDKTQPVAQVSFSLFFSPSVQLQSLCFFLNLRNQFGNLELRDPVTHAGTSQNGRQYSIQSYDFLSGKDIWAILVYKGMYVNPQTSVQIPNFDFKGFCDRMGRSAHECAENIPNAEDYKKELMEVSMANSLPQAPQPQLTVGANGQAPDQQLEQVAQQIKQQPQGAYAPQAQQRAPQGAYAPQPQGAYSLPDENPPF